MDLDFAIDDISFAQGDIVFCEKREAIRQDIIGRLRRFKGECFFAPDEGMPYYEEIFIKNPATNVLNVLFSEAILSTPGVIELVTFSLDFDAPTRQINVSFEARTLDSNDNIVFTEFVL